jgi:AcrR family transcriptional regulator/DNA-binding MarR family transcriptional regulator
MAANTPDARLRMRNPVPGPRGGGRYVSELQRTRLLDAAFELVAEQGFRRMAARKVAERAGVSPKTFYDLFADREDCFLATFDHAVEELAAVARPAYEGEGEWVARIRAALGALLDFLDREPELCRLVFIEALGAGARVLERRAEILERLERVIDEGRAGAKGAGELPPLTAAGIVGATFSVIHGQLLQQHPESLSALLNPLMATIVFPYRGRKAAARELERPISKAGPRTLPTLPHLPEGSNPPNHQGSDLLPADRSRPPSRPRDLISGPAGRTSGSRAGSRQSSGSCAGPGRTSGSRADLRLTVRTYAVLQAVAAHPGVSNREVSDLVRVADQGQISRLMARLEERGLLENAGGQVQGVAKAWRLTSQGQEVVRAADPASGDDKIVLGVCDVR